MNEAINRIDRLARLHRRGVLTEEEFRAGVANVLYEYGVRVGNKAAAIMRDALDGDPLPDLY